jgi:hypothetical protein
MNIKLNYLGNIIMSDRPFLPYMKFGPISTQNINTPSDYCLEQKKNKQTVNWNLNPYGAGGMAVTPAFTEAGSVPPSRIWRDQLSGNPIDTESWLMNLDQRLGDCPEKRTKFCPKMKYLPMLSFYERPKNVIMPEPLVVKWNERPHPVAKK